MAIAAKEMEGKLEVGLLNNSIAELQYGMAV